MKGKGLGLRGKKIGALLLIMVSCTPLTGCVHLGPISLNRAVIQYDSSVLKSEEELLLLNIIRMHDDQPPHFTVASDIKATFSFSSKGGVNASFLTGSSSDTIALSLDATATENPTITISPMQGKDFAQRLLKPMDIAIANIVFLQRAQQIDKMLRLIGHSFVMEGKKNTEEVLAGIEKKDAKKKIKLEYPKKVKVEECFKKEQDKYLLVNRPPKIPLIPLKESEKRKDKQHYELFRQVVLHIMAMSRSGQLQIFPLEFEQEVEGAATEKPQQTKDITDALDKQYRWKKQKEGYILTKTYTIPAILNFSKDELDKPILEKIARHLELTDYLKFDQSVVLVLLRADEQNQWPIYGLFRLRNFRQILQFLAESLRDEPGYEREYDVPPIEITKVLADLDEGANNPPLTLRIYSGKTPPRDSVVAVEYKGEYFWVSSTSIQTVAQPQPVRWDEQVFNLLYEIF